MIERDYRCNACLHEFVKWGDTMEGSTPYEDLPPDIHCPECFNESIEQIVEMKSWRRYTCKECECKWQGKFDAEIDIICPVCGEYGKQHDRHFWNRSLTWDQEGYEDNYRDNHVDNYD